MNAKSEIRSLLAQAAAQASQADLRDGILDTLGFILAVFRRNHPPQAVAGLQAAMRHMLIESSMRAAFGGDDDKPMPAGTAAHPRGRQIVFSMLHTEVMVLINVPGGDLQSVVHALVGALAAYSDDADDAGTLMRRVLGAEQRFVEGEDRATGDAWNPEGVFLVH